MLLSQTSDVKQSKHISSTVILIFLHIVTKDFNRLSCKKLFKNMYKTGNSIRRLMSSALRSITFSTTRDNKKNDTKLAHLAHVVIETFETSVSETNNWIFFADVAFCFVFR